MNEQLEIAVISVDWLVLIAAAFMLAVVFRRDVVRLRYPIKGTK